MNDLVIPPSANWYESSILACAPDNTAIYGSRNDIVIIYDSPDEEPSDVKIIPRAHSQKLVSVNVNKNWGQPNKLLVTVAEDNIVKLWDIETRKKKLAHNAHAGHGKVVGATFAGDDRIISVSEEGVIIIWNIPVNQTNVIKNIFGLKVTITCISTCPHANWLTAFGLKNGLVVVTDLRKQGKVLYKLRGHDKSVLSLSWCPAPINIFPKDPHNYVGEKGSSDTSTEQNTPVKQAISKENGNTVRDPTSDIKTVTPTKPTTEDKPNNTLTKKNIWSNLKHADDDEYDDTTEEQQKPRTLFKDESDDFLKECQTLKEMIMGEVPIKSEAIAKEGTDEKDRVIIKAKRNKQQSEQIQDHLENEGSALNTETDLPKVSVEIKEHLIDSQDLQDTMNRDETKSPVDKINMNLPETETCSLTKENTLEENFRIEVNVDTTADKNTKKNKENLGVVCDVPGQTETLKDSNKVAEIKSSTDTLNVNLHETETGSLMRENTLKENSRIEVNGDKGVDESTKENEENLEVDPNKTHVETEAVEDSNNKSTVAEGGNKMTCEEVKREIPVTLPEKEEPRREFLLASSGKEGNIYIWRAGTDGRMQTFLSVPNKPGHRKFNKSYFDKLWIVLCWISPTVLLSSSKSAELVKWILPKPKDKNKQFSIIHCDHNSMLFSIAAPTVLLNEHNWREERMMNVWTVGHDRLLLNTSLTSKRKNLSCYPTLGNAECFALSPVDPNRLAVGTAEGVIKVWDLSRPNIKNIVMTSFYQKIQSRVVTLAWHPTNEILLAYGTVEGRVGFVDTNNKSKSPTLASNFFKSQIHKVEWGPIDGSEDDFGLFAVSEGKVISFSDKKSERGPVEVDIPDNTFAYTFAWKPDYTMLLVGTRTGTVILYSRELKILSTHYFQHRLNNIYWHPDATMSDLSVSPRCYWFAAISNTKNVIVCDFQDSMEDGDKVVAKYEQSEELINCVSWSPYTWDKLVIASDDGAVQVWNMESNKIESTYTSPNFEGVLAAIWSPLESDYMISAAKDHTIRVWKISDYPKQDEKDIKELRKKALKEINNEQADLLPKVEKTQEELPKSKKLVKTNLLPNFFYPKETPQVVDNLRKLFLWKEGSNGTEVGGGGDNNHTCDILKVFGSKSDMLEIVEQNEKAHRERGKYGLGNTLSLFKGDISTKIKKAIEERRVTPWIISMAPMVSPKVWQSACQVYAEQLLEVTDSDPVEIATYYLACHKVEEAIDALCQGTLYREALALAKCRLPEDSPTIPKVMDMWAKYSVAVGNFEAAVQCYIYLHKYEDAASVLFRRSDVETLKFATELAEKSGNADLHKAVLFRYNAFKAENIEEKESQLPSKLDVVLKHQEEDDGKDENVVLEESACLNQSTDSSKDENEETKTEVQVSLSVESKVGDSTEVDTFSQQVNQFVEMESTDSVGGTKTEVGE